MTNRKSQVLIVDDEPAICQLISHLLEQEGLIPISINLADHELFQSL